MIPKNTKDGSPDTVGVHSFSSYNCAHTQKNIGMQHRLEREADD